MTTDREAIRMLVAEWTTMRDWAADLLVENFDLDSPRDILRPEHRGKRSIPGTGWFYRTHGIGVDVVHEHGRGGIDFDFGSPALFASPDWWRLLLFARRAIHAGTLPRQPYELLIGDEDAFRALVESVLQETEVP